VTSTSAVPASHFDDRTGGIGIEVAGRLVGEKDPGPVNEGPGQGDPLLFAPGKLERVVIEPVAEADLAQKFLGFLLAAAFATELERDQHVFDRGERRDELEALEDEADEPVSQCGPRVLAERFESLSIELHRAARRVIEPGTQPQQRCLSAARRPDDSERVAVLQCQRDVAQHRQLVTGGAVDFPQVADLEEGSFDSICGGS
jgi:hypothetical protein